MISESEAPPSAHLSALGLSEVHVLGAGAIAPGLQGTTVTADAGDQGLSLQAALQELGGHGLVHGGGGGGAGGNAVTGQADRGRCR